MPTLARSGQIGRGRTAESLGLLTQEQVCARLEKPMSTRSLRRILRLTREQPALLGLVSAGLIRVGTADRLHREGRAEEVLLAVRQAVMR